MIIGVDRYRRGWVGVVLPEAEVIASTDLAGLLQRVAEAECVRIEIPELLDEAGVVPVADVLDAAAAAWSAQRYAEGEACPLPPDATRDVIWY